MTQRLRFPTGLYGITPDWQDIERLMHTIEQCCHAGLPVLQWRRKHTHGTTAIEQATRVAQICRQYGTHFIINDDWRLALAVDADGVHLGRNDGSVSELRQALREHTRTRPLTLGVSCYNSLDLARQAIADEVDYFAFGAVFTSSVKPDAVTAPLSLFSQARALMQDLSVRPTLVGIGGITLDNAKQVMQTGSDSCAVISGLFETDHPAQTTASFVQLLNTNHVK